MRKQKKSCCRNGRKNEDDDDESKITHAGYILCVRAFLCECVVYKNAIKILLCSLDLGLSVSHKIYDIERVTLIWTTAQLDNTPNGLFSNFNRLPLRSRVPERIRTPQFISIPEHLYWVDVHFGIIEMQRIPYGTEWPEKIVRFKRTNEWNVYLASVSNAPIATIRSSALNLNMHVKVCEHPPYK